MNMYQQPYGQPAADPMAYIAALEARIRGLEMRLPNTSVIAPTFMKRAFAVWGHFFVANMIIGIVVGIIMTIVSVVFAGSMFSVFSDVLTNGGY